MRIGIVGGVERGQGNYERIAAEHGHTVELHGGHARGRGLETLESLVSRSDLVVVTTDINSHAAVRVTRRLARKYGCRQLLARSLGLARFAALLASLGGGEPLLAPG